MLINSTADFFSVFRRRYPVGMTSMLKSLILLADITCSSIKYFGFLPLKSDKNKIASALSDICEESPGNKIIGKSVFSFINNNLLLKLSSTILDPPTSKPSKFDLFTVSII